MIVKIISNPYAQDVSFQRKADTNSEWVDINYEDNKNSKLLSDQIKRGFFPFQVKNILNTIVDAYYIEGEELEVVFEGSSDEYAEIESICSTDNDFSMIKLSKSNTLLENARDILPDIREVFQSLKPIIDSTTTDDKTQKDIYKYTESSKDLIPICVFGNYSSGKSTFINALIGSELLPSGDNALTAKIYEITRSPYDDRANIHFDYDDKVFTIRFLGDEYQVSNLVSDIPLASILSEELSKIRDEDLMVKASKVLSIVNNYEDNAETRHIDDMISVEIPFKKGILGNSNNPFMIFDTPGSNTASHAEHIALLKEKMANLSNGIPIIISEYGDLDSTDNEKLKQYIRDSSELDDRFTMIVINKADAANLPDCFDERQIDGILNSAVPKNLDAEGIFFTSSIMGLGSKVDGDFKDDHYDEVYYDNERKYNTPDNKRYKQLYKYNIMPEQIKKKAVEDSQKCEDLIYANSGLYCIEEEINTFAGKYSQYNKCQQSYKFLDRVIESTKKAIEQKRDDNAKYKDRMEEVLERDKKELWDKLSDESERLRRSYSDDHEKYMKSFLDEVQSSYSTNQIDSIEEETTNKQTEQHSLSSYNKDLESKKDALRTEFKSDLKAFFDHVSVSSIKDIGKDIRNNYNDIKESKTRLNDAKNDVVKDTSADVLNIIKTSFHENAEKARESIDTHSKDYWSEHALKLKGILSDIVTDSAALDADRREKLAQIIIQYVDIQFDDTTEQQFMQGEFNWQLKILNRVLISSDRLDNNKLAKTYNKTMSDNIKNIYKTIKDSHEKSFDIWLDNLMKTINDNIVEFNPKLSNQMGIIRDKENEIAELESKERRLVQYTEQIKSMMRWQEV